MAAEDLISLQQVKDYLGIKNPDDDVKLGGLVTECSVAILNYLSRDIKQATHAEKYNGNGARYMVLRNFPILSVTSLSIDNVPIAASPNGVQAGYRFDDATLVLVGYSFTRGLLNVSVTYSAGYAAVPEDIQQACIQLVSDRLKLVSRIGERSKALPQGGSVSYDTAFLPERVKGALLPYRRMWPA